MILARHLLRLMFEVLRFGRSTRRVGLVLALVVGLVLLAVATTATVAAPVVLYPFG